MSKTHYDVLGVNELAGGAKIKRHYYDLCKKYHPDMAGGDPQKMIAINEAYQILSSPSLKAAYDRELASARRDADMAAASTKARQSAEPTWQQAAQGPATASQRAYHEPARRKRGKGMVWFMAFGGAAAALVIVATYLAPFPSVATTTTPTVATSDNSQSSPNTSTVTTVTPPDTSSSSQAAATPVAPTDTNAATTTTNPTTSVSTTPTTTNSTPTSQTTTQPAPTTNRHHKPWLGYIQNPDN